MQKPMPIQTHELIQQHTLIQPTFETQSSIQLQYWNWNPANTQTTTIETHHQSEPNKHWNNPLL